MGPRLVAAAAAAAPFGLAAAFVPSPSPNWGPADASLAPSTGDGSGASGDIGSMMEQMLRERRRSQESRVAADDCWLRDGDELRWAGLVETKVRSVARGNVPWITIFLWAATWKTLCVGEKGTKSYLNVR